MKAVIAAELFYFGAILLLRAIFPPKQPTRDAPPPAAKRIGLLEHAIALHNTLLSLLSALMFVGTLLAALRRTSTSASPLWLLCEHKDAKAKASPTHPPTPDPPKGAEYFWSYVYFLSKFVEFFDTFFKALKRKPLDFLHLHHHALVVVMCYLWLVSAQSLQFVGLLANSLVHVFMYAYYAYTTYMPPPKWKRYVTSLQIVQFGFSFVCLAATLVIHARGGECAGMGALLFNSLFNLSLLYHFVDFSKKSYGGKRVANAPKEKGQ